MERWKLEGVGGIESRSRFWKNRRERKGAGACGASGKSRSGGGQAELRLNRTKEVGEQDWARWMERRKGEVLKWVDMNENRDRSCGLGYYFFFSSSTNSRMKENQD